jgi:DNA-binding LytR/AlgR family response regulator
VEYYFTDRDMLRIRRKLDDATAELSSYIFSRIHNRITVNMSAIKRVDYPNLEITLNDDTVLNISRSFKAQFEKAYALYLKNYC